MIHIINVVVCMLIAGSILCQVIISATQIDQGHTYLLVEFCKLFEALYGPDYCKPNLHMSCHLRNCLSDFD